MSRSLAALALLAPLPALAAQESDATRLLPPGATVVVRLESARAWNELVHSFAPLAGEAAAQHDLQAVLDGMASDAARRDPAGLPRLAPEQPLFLSVSLDPAQGPGLTFVVPVANDRPLQLQPQAMGGAHVCAQLGGYRGVSSIPGYGAAAEPNALAAGLQPGLVAVRVDLATLIENYRPLLEMALRQAEMALEQTPSDELPTQLQPLMGAYLAAVRGLVDQAEMLDLALEGDGDELALRFDYRERAERGIAAAVADPMPLFGRIDPASPIQLAFSGKVTAYPTLFEGFMTAALEAYPEPLRTDLKRALDLSKELDPLLAPGLAVGMDFGAAGLRGSYALRSPESAKLAQAIEDLLRTFDHEGGLLRVGAAERLTVDGMEARVLPIEIQYEAACAALSAMNGAAAGQHADAAELRQALESLYGRELRLALAPAGDLVLVSLDHGDAELRASLARLARPATPDPKLARLATRLAPGALGFAYHFDFGQTMSRMSTAMKAFLPAPVSFPDVPASLELWGALRGRTWSGGMAMSTTELFAFVRALQGLASK